MRVTFFHANPLEMLPYTMDWTDWLNDETILASVWRGRGGAIALTKDEIVGDTTRVWAGQGQTGQVITLANRIKTTRGRTHTRAFQLRLGA